VKIKNKQSELTNRRRAEQIVLKKEIVMEITGQTAVVTGGASGLGKAAAEMLASKGAKVAVLDMNGDAAETVSRTTGGLGMECDVTDPEKVQIALGKISDSIGVPRMCINAAGVGTAGLVIGKEGPLPLEKFSRVIDINVNGTFNVLRLAAANMVELEPLPTTERGIIINVSSVAAYEGQRGQAAYAASKGAIAAMTLPLAREFSRYGIRVMTVAPGIFDTPLLKTLPENVQKSLAASIPFPARLGDPQEFASLVCHLTENSSLNGETIRLDGAVRLS
tara:strand:- start:704 stop:1537 length:834 start_codon:yes stop_codon:yes gene_type:complete